MHSGVVHIRLALLLRDGAQSIFVASLSSFYIDWPNVKLRGKRPLAMIHLNDYIYSM